jgi:polysaccharide transporter, PST family
MAELLWRNRWASASELLRRLSSHTIIRNALLLYTVQITGYIFPLIALRYLSRVLSTDHFGMVAYAQNFAWYFVTLTEYGFNLTATRAVAVSKDSPDPEAVNRVFGSVMVAKFLLTLLGLLILIVVVLSVPSLRPNLVLFLVAFLSVVGYFLFPLWLYQGMQKMGSIALRDFIAKLLSLAALFVFVRSDKDYLLAASVQSGALVIAGLIGVITVSTKLKVKFRFPSAAAVRDQLVSGWPAFLSLAVLSFTFVTNTFVLGLVAPATEFAYFSAAWRIISTLRSLYAPLTMAIFPHTSQKAVGSEESVISFIRRYRWYLAAPFITAGIVLIAGAPLVIHLMLSAKFERAIPVLQIMAFGPALFAFTQIYGSYHMIACGFDKEWMRIVLIAVAANFVALAIFLSILPGSIALAWTTLFGDAFAAFLYWRFFRSRVRALGV